ncbi:putative non-specific serine/threonine protein kinase [Helianthus debilis subsp. tardiflorus]
MSLLDCETACKNNFWCTAYANPNITAGGVGCLLWFGGLIDIRVGHNTGKICMLDLRLQNYQVSQYHYQISAFHVSCLFMSAT